MMLRDQDLAYDRQLTDLILRYRGAHRFENQPFVPSEPAFAAIFREVRRLETAMPNGADPVLALHWRESLETFGARVEEDQRFPFRFIQGLNGTLSRLVMEDPRPFEERLPGVLARAESAADIMAEVRRMCCRLTPHRIEMVAGALASLRKVLVTAVEHAATVWPSPERVVGALRQIDGAASELQVNLPTVVIDPLEDLAYADVLARVFGASLEETLTWYQDEIDARHQDYLALAARIRPGADPKLILAEELPHAPSPEAMFAEMRGYVAQARQACLELMSLPEGEVCTVDEVPDQIKDSYPWGAYSGPPILSSRLDGKCLLNQHNYTAVSRGWMQMMALHECYPGHHAQRVKVAVADLPESFKAALGMTRDSHLAEGIAHRSETMLQHIFPDRAFPLFVAYRRLHTAVRIRADIELHHQRRPVEEVCGLYARYLGFTQPEARGQVRFQEMWPGYMTTYYTGMRALEVLERRLRPEPRRWNELLFSAGFVSLKVLEAMAV